MKTTLKSLPVLICALFLSVFMANCQDDSYLHDGGTHNPYYDGTVWEYLNSRPDYFKTLVEVIQIAGMEDVFRDEEITFFAPTDWSVKRSVNYLSGYLYKYMGKDSIKDLRQIKPEVWKEYLSLYIVKDKYLLKDIPQLDTAAVAAYPGQAYYSYGGRPMNVGVVYAEANGVKYAGYRQILYSYINDFTTQDMQNAYIATCDIQPVNGVVHVIRFIDHDFGFIKSDFRTKAINVGITPLDQINKKEEEDKPSIEEKDHENN